ncbi:MAG TPA: hypothetical protein VH592_16745 [Gemmataceae bacterium]|jgi:hypothetical protein
MDILSVILLLAAADRDDGLAKKMLPIYLKEASEYSMAVESAPEKKLDLKKEPVFEWSNPVRGQHQQGVVFLWLRDGRPAALGSIWSEPDGDLPRRRVYHEFHALDRARLLVSRPDALNEWNPQVGLVRKEIPEAGSPAATAGARLVQMKRLAQLFTGYETDAEEKRWELRLLPAPLYRYTSAKSDVMDGALFTLVSNAGTDPEVLLLIEARKDGDKTRWEYACGRFSDRDLHVQYKDTEVWSSIRGENDTYHHDLQHLYRIYADKIVSLDGKLLARVRTSPPLWRVEVLPVDEK